MLINGRDLYIGNVCGNSEEKENSSGVMNERSLYGDCDILNEQRECIGTGEAER